MFDTNKVFGKVILFINILSVTTAVKVTVCKVEEPWVVKLIIVLSAVKEEILGGRLSILLIVISKLAVEELPTISVTVATTWSVFDPKL